MTALLVDPDVRDPAQRRTEVIRAVLDRTDRRYVVATRAEVVTLYAALQPGQLLHVHISADPKPSWVMWAYEGRVYTLVYAPAGRA